VKTTKRFEIRSFAFVLHMSGYINCSKILETCLNTRHLMGDMKHIPNWGPHGYGVDCAEVHLGANSREVPGSISNVVTHTHTHTYIYIHRFLNLNLCWYNFHLHVLARIIVF